MPSNIAGHGFVERDGVKWTRPDFVPCCLCDSHGHGRYKRSDLQRELKELAVERVLFCELVVRQDSMVVNGERAAAQVTSIH